MKTVFITVNSTVGSLSRIFFLLVAFGLFFTACEKESFTNDPEATLQKTEEETLRLIPNPDHTEMEAITTLAMPAEASGDVAELRGTRTLVYSELASVAPAQWKSYWYAASQLPDPNRYKMEVVVTPITGNPYLGIYGYQSNRANQFRLIADGNTLGVETAGFRRSNLLSGETHAYIGVFGHGNVVTRYKIEIFVVEVCAPEDCVSFNPGNTAVRQVGNLYLVVDGNHSMFAAPNRTEANQIVQIIRFYGLDQSCFVGRPDPSFQYMLKNGLPPVGPMPGEDCVSFNPDNIQVVKINGRWKIVEGNHWIFDFESNESEARQAFCLIKQYGFTKSCFVGRPNPSLQYMRK